MNNEISKTKAFLWIGFLAAVNYLIVGGFFGIIALNIGRVMLAVWGGWYIVSKAKSNLWFAALVGVIIMTVDHVILKGGHFLLIQLMWPEKDGADAFGGVLISFIMFAPIAALISLGGGFIGRKKSMSSLSINNQ